MRLVIQEPSIAAPSLLAQTLSEIQQLSQSSGSFVQLTDHAYYLPLQSQPDTTKISQYCQSHALDYALVADEHTLQNIGLAVMDMDSTLINIECIDEIADMMGIKPMVAEITESAMRGEIQFEESLRRRVGLLKGLDASSLQRVIEERLQLNPGAKEWIAACKQHGIKTMLVSGGFDFFADYLKNLLGLDYAHSNSLEIIDGKLTGQVLGKVVDAQAKADFLIQARNQLGLNQSQVIAIGDGANDLTMMKEAAAGIAYHAKPVVQQQATYALNHSGLDGIINLFSTHS
ncbi:MAG: phosphoserine phosphatase SerB [Methylophilaceae bacterium]|nr:phosphoserine phosphatase SerB [Methyloradius sp.]